MCDKENSYEPKTKEDAERALKLFCAKFERISEYSFFKVEKIGVRHEHKIAQGYTELFYEGPTNEQIDAVLLHLRFFLGKNESSSIFHLKKCFDLVGAEESSKRKLEDVLKLREKWQGESSRICDLSNSELFAILIWGGRIHANSQKRIESYDELMRFELFKAEEEFHLSRTIFEFLKIIQILAELIKSEVTGRIDLAPDSPNLPLGST